MTSMKNTGTPQATREMKYGIKNVPKKEKMFQNIHFYFLLPSVVGFFLQVAALFARHIKPNNLISIEYRALNKDTRCDCQP